MIEKIKIALRFVLSGVLNYPFYIFFRNKYELSRNGEPLKPGISAVVAAKNEEYIIPYCLNSLKGIADQIICIDNGSTDSTMQLMEKFKFENPKIHVDVISLPNALLGDCREAGLNATKHQWHLRWDADMVCKSSGPENMKILKDKILKKNNARAIRLPRTNLEGDFHHASKIGKIVDPGEPILVRFSKWIKYVEYGKFDTIRLPLFYKSTYENKRYYFHCQGLKSESRLIYRQCYFIWRDLCNKTTDAFVLEKLKNFELFKKFYEFELFGTNDVKQLKYRHTRQYCTLHYTHYDKEKYGDYPDVIKTAIANKEERFFIKYKDDKPYIRVDKDDKEMINYSPTKDDLSWNINDYIERLNDFENIFNNKFLDFINSNS